MQIIERMEKITTGEGPRPWHCKRWGPPGAAEDMGSTVQPPVWLAWQHAINRVVLHLPRSLPAQQQPVSPPCLHRVAWRPEGEWIARLDLVERGDRLAVVEMDSVSA